MERRRPFTARDLAETSGVERSGKRRSALEERPLARTERGERRAEEPSNRRERTGVPMRAIVVELTEERRVIEDAHLRRDDRHRERQAIEATEDARDQRELVVAHAIPRPHPLDERAPRAKGVALAQGVVVLRYAERRDREAALVSGGEDGAGHEHDARACAREAACERDRCRACFFGAIDDEHEPRPIRDHRPEPSPRLDAPHLGEAEREERTASEARLRVPRRRGDEDGARSERGLDERRLPDPGGSVHRERARHVDHREEQRALGVAADVPSRGPQRRPPPVGFGVLPRTLTTQRSRTSERSR